VADPVPQEWLDDIKPLIRKLAPSVYLKFRENKIADQGDSNNCGHFCVRFLQQRLKGDSFAEATGWNQLGEHNIELWKKHPKQRLWISGQKGEGLRDIYDKVRKGATKVIQRIKDTLSGPRNTGSPAVRGWLEKHGQKEIRKIWVCKKPIYSMIEKIGNWLSRGKLRENMDKLGYESMMHLFMIVELEDGTSVKIEKNHVVEIKNSRDKGKQFMDAPVKSGRTVQGQLDSAEKRVGADKLWKYHLVDANCQWFVLWFLEDMITSEIHEFVKQDAASSLKDMGLLAKAATVITDIAGAADVALQGAGSRQFPYLAD
jgi:hypothetical protein